MWIDIHRWGGKGMGWLRGQSHSCGGLNNLHGAFLPGFLWPIILLCLALSRSVINSESSPVCANLLAKTDFSTEACGKVDITYYAVVRPLFGPWGAFLHVCSWKVLLYLKNKKYAVSLSLYLFFPFWTFPFVPTNVWIVKVIVFSIVMYGCESWTVKNAECGRHDAFELWCWKILLRVPWTERRSNQSILKEISPEYSLEGLMLMLQYFGHLMQRADSLEKTLMLGKIEGRRRRGWQRKRWLNGITDSMDMSLSKLLEMV